MGAAVVVAAELTATLLNVLVAGVSLNLPGAENGDGVDASPNEGVEKAFLESTLRLAPNGEAAGEVVVFFEAGNAGKLSEEPNGEEPNGEEPNVEGTVSFEAALSGAFFVGELAFKRSRSSCLFPDTFKPRFLHSAFNALTVFLATSLLSRSSFSSVGSRRSGALKPNLT
jgi:hypothetical protein